MQQYLFRFERPEQKMLNEINTVEIDGEIWFVAGDVCKALDISNVSDALSRLENDEKLTSVLPMSGQRREVYLVNESGLYVLIFKSRKDSAIQFRRWITREVIPSIRKTGSYGRSSNISQLPNFTQRYKANIKNVKPRYFSIINELYIRLFASLEGVGYIIPDSTLEGAHMSPDISVGKTFPVYLSQHNSPFLETRQKYMHEFPDGRKSVEAYQYPVAALDTFYNFIFDYWIPNCAEKYFKKRDPVALDYLPKLLINKAD